MQAGPRVRHPDVDAGGRALDGSVAGSGAGPVTGPVRTCVGCRGRGPRSVLLRVVQVDAGEGGPAHLVVDTARARPGRGAWLHPDLQCLELAERRRAFPRALRTGPSDTAAVRAHLEARSAEG